jgi:hypothetical protein
MKKFLLTAWVALSGAIAFAGVDEPTKTSNAAIIKKGESKFALIYQAAETATVRVSIRNDRGELLFSETLRKVDGFIRPYDFSSLPKGNYSITIEGNGTKQVEKISYQTGVVENQIFLTRLAGENRFLLSAKSNDNEEVTVRILNEQQQVLHQEKRLATGDFAQVYRIEKLVGAVTFEVTRGNGKTESISY